MNINFNDPVARLHGNSRRWFRPCRGATNRKREDHDHSAVEIVISRKLETQNDWLERDEIERLAEPLRSARCELQAASANLACQRNRFPVREMDLAYAEMRAEWANAAYAQIEQSLGEREPDKLASLARIFRNTKDDASTAGHESDPMRLPYAIGAALTCGFIVGALL